ncbi:MAG: CocE/NonD family hydrolase [Planctomycetaceae bacterium]
MRAAASRALCTVAFTFIGIAFSAAAEIEQTEHMVAMRDGTKLATVVYRPAKNEQPLPVVLARGPYGTFGEPVGKTICDKGYVLVSQDMRGRHKSQGSDAVVFHNDGWSKNRDGHDTIDWIAKQKWCNGNVATWGASALGITQNMLAPEAPEALKAQYVGVAFSNMYEQGAYQGGVFRKSLLEQWLQSQKFDPESLRTFVAHPRYDDFWAELSPESVAQRVHAPAIYMGGWYDIFLQGTINSFVTVHNQGAGKARGNCRLIIGPYAHGTFDELKYPEKSNKRPLADDPFRFYDYWLKGTDNGVPDDKPVNYYVMGDPEDSAAPGNIWRSAENWPPPFKPRTLYFHSVGRLAAEVPSAADARLTYEYDPAHPVPTVGGQNLFLPKGPMDQRKVELRDDVRVFTTEALTEPLEVTGRIIAKLFVSSDCPDTDFTVKLCDVYPDGRSMLVTDGILRARYRTSFREEEFLEQGRVYELSVDLWSTSLIFNKGHRVRVAVSSSNAPRFEPNPNTGKPFRADDETRVATNTLHVSSTSPSAIILPIYDGPTDEKN